MILPFDCMRVAVHLIKTTETSYFLSVIFIICEHEYLSQTSHSKNSCHPAQLWLKTSYYSTYFIYYLIFLTLFFFLYFLKIWLQNVYLPVPTVYWSDMILQMGEIFKPRTLWFYGFTFHHLEIFSMSCASFYTNFLKMWPNIFELVPVVWMLAQPEGLWGWNGFKWLLYFTKKHEVQMPSSSYFGTLQIQL